MRGSSTMQCGKVMAVAIVAAAASFQPSLAASVSVIPSSDATYTGIPAEIPDKGANVCVDQLVENPLRLNTPPPRTAHRVHSKHRPHVRRPSSAHRKTIRRVHRPTVQEVVGEPQHILHCVFLPPPQPAIESFTITFARAMSAVRPDNFDNWFQTVIRPRARSPFASPLGIFANAAPEPASWALMIGGFLLIGATMRWRIKSRGIAAAAPESRQ
jgi:hypothetical protein